LDKWSTTIAARDLAFVCARSGLDLDHLIKGIAVRAFEGNKRRRSSGHDTSSKSGSDSIKINIGARKLACNLTPMSPPWDTAAGTFLVDEAGSRVTTFSTAARPTDQKADILASNTLCMMTFSPYWSNLRAQEG
jgi:Inositol monophosphatase family